MRKNSKMTEAEELREHMAIRTDVRNLKERIERLYRETELRLDLKKLRQFLSTWR